VIQISTFTNEEDTQQIVDLILNIQINEFNVPLTAKDQPDLFIIPDFYQRAGGNFWLAKNDAEVVGTIALIACGDGVGAIRKMFVKKAFRGKEHNIAQKLFDILEIAAKNQKMRALYLGTLERLQAAIRFYERNGFTLIDKANLPTVFPLMPVDTHFFAKNI
jgi:putative acetyltransferase